MDMQASDTSQLTPIKPSQLGKQLTVLLVAVFCFMLGLLFSPENARDMGVMARSLNSDIELVRHTTLLEIQFIRVMLILFSLLLLVVGLWWNRIIQSSFVVLLSSENPQTTFKPIPTRSSLILIALIILASFVYLIMDSYILDPSVSFYISGEDRLIEQLTALLFLVCSLQAAVILFKTHGWIGKVFPFIFSLGFFLCFGEEISWGQRILGWETPEMMLAANIQGETNLHNMSGYFADHLFIAGTFLYGAVLPLLANNSLVLRNLCFRIGLPVASLHLAVGFCLASLIHDWTIYNLIDKGTLRAAELREMLSAVCFSLLMRESMFLQKESR